MLHNDKELFKQIVIATGDTLGLDYGIVEKDYYATELLRKISIKEPKIIFKGGTSLSKCYGTIKRFSEDIDFGFECLEHPTQSEKVRMKRAILSSIEELGFTLTNLGEIKSRMEYNKYIVSYPANFEATILKPNLILETSVFVRAYPSMYEKASSYLYDYLKNEKGEKILEKYSLEPFEVRVQSLERTFIDKIFAICDYYLDGRITEHSRHIYDLYKLWQEVNIKEELKELFKQVREDRKSHSACLSAQDNVDLVEILKEIKERNIYKSDYELITKFLIFENVEYETAIGVISQIIKSGLFSITKQ